MHQRLLDGLPLQIAVLDGAGRVVACNAAWRAGAAERCGRPGPCGVGDDYLGAWDDGTPEELLDGVRSVLAGVRGSYDRAYACPRPDGRERRVAVHAAALGEGAVVSHHLDGAAPDGDERWRAVARNVPGITALTFDAALRCTAAEGAGPSAGRRADELLGRTPADLFAPDRREATEALCRAALAGEVREVEARSRSGRWLLARFVPLREDGAATAGMVLALDVTERREHETRLRHLADHDALTGLLNRRAFEAALAGHAAHGRRYGADGAVLVLDLDQFKLVNDTLGHREGDRLLVGIAGALRTRLRDSDVLARLGGDEFGVLLPHADADEARLVAEDLLALVHEQTVVFGDAAARGVSTSIGVALVADRPGATPEELLVSADLAMYEAKEAGRDRLAFFRPSRGEARARARVGWPQRIEGALEHGRFELHAQPVVSLADGQVVQHELLVRMRSDSGDVVPPAAFLPVAERHGLITRLDRWVVGRAVEVLRRSAEAGSAFAVAVNLSAQSMGDPELLADLEAHLDRAPQLAARLVVEVPEAAAVADVAHARALAERLSALGCRFALDDFGAGLASLYHLKHLPFDLVKIDGEFVRRCAGDPVDQLVVQSVVHLARGLGRRTVAEHVEDDATAAALRAHGVDFAQGFGVGVPRPLAEALGQAAAA